jgi:mitochondrial inner membrane protease subunit 2
MVASSTFLRPLLLGIPIGLTFFDSVGYIARVEGVSMQPTFNPDSPDTEGGTSDFVYLDRIPLRNYCVQRGDVVSLISPKNRSEVLIKRVVGLEGDLVVTKRYKKPLVRVPKGHCWVEGDNANRSMDSNEFGPLSLGLVTAKATFILWPLSRFKHLQTTDRPQAIYSY